MSGRYNKRASAWKTVGMEEFSNNTVTVTVNGTPYKLEMVKVEATETLPCGDKCNKEEDPEGGCERVASVFFRGEVPVSGESLEISLADTMHAESYNETVALSQSKEYLQRICYRIGDAHASILDLPPTYAIGKNVTDAGCEFGNNWEPYHYSDKKVEKVVFEARSYMDPFVASSYLTRGCSEKEGNTNCFGLSHKEMSTYGMYGIIVAGSITVIELITLLSMCLCCREKLNCCSKEYDDLSY